MCLFQESYSWGKKKNHTVGFFFKVVVDLQLFKLIY